MKGKRNPRERPGTLLVRFVVPRGDFINFTSSAHLFGARIVNGTRDALEVSVRSLKPPRRRKEVTP